MPQQQSIVFITKSFLQTVSTVYLKSPLSFTTDEENIYYFFNNIFQECTIYLDIDEAEIANHLEMEENNIFTTTTDDDLKVLLNYISSKNKIKNCSTQIKKFIDDNYYINYEAEEIKPDFIFVSDFNEELCKKISGKYGLLCVNNYNELHSFYLKDVSPSIFQPNCIVDYNQEFRYLPKVKSLIIEDPYLFAGNTYTHVNFLIAFIERLIFRAGIRVDITIFYTYNHYEVQYINELSNTFNELDNIKLEIIQTDQIHDRWVFTNLFIINSGSGWRSFYHREVSFFYKLNFKCYHFFGVKLSQYLNNNDNLTNRLFSIAI